MAKVSPYTSGLLSEGYSAVSTNVISSVEEPGGFQNEMTEFEFVGIKDEKYWHGRVTYTKNFAPRGNDRWDDNGKSEITEREYREKLNAFGGMEDTIAYRNAVTAERARVQAQQEKDRQNALVYESLRPQCPLCGEKMAVRSGPFSHFWGCTSYPDCNGTRKITRTTRDRLAEIGKI